LLAIETGELVLLLTAIAYSSKIVEAGALRRPLPVLHVTAASAAT
jgi:hypothetical protein